MNRTYVFTDFGGPEHQRFMDLPVPTVDPGQVLVSVMAAGVNPTDWKQRANLRGDRTLDGPMPMGREVAGVVEQVGTDVVGFEVGDEVFGAVAGSGGFAEHALVGSEIARKPASVSFTDASTLPIACATAFDGVAQLDLRPGETLVINGVGGGVGVAAAQLARARGANVVGVASEKKRSFVESLGVTLVPYGDGVADRVTAASPEGLDAVLDLVGGDAMRALAPAATNASRVVAVADGAASAEIGGVRIVRARTAEVLEAVATLVAEGTLDPTVTSVFPFDRVGEALALVESGHATGKVVVQIT